MKMASKMLLSSAKGFLILGLIFLQTSLLSAQTTRSRISKRPKPVRNEPLPKVARDLPLLQVQMTALRQIFFKYDDYDSPRFVWGNDQIWWDILKIRADLDPLAQQAPAADRPGIWSTQYEMEHTVLTLLASNHLDFLVSQLELSDDQIGRMDKVLQSDVARKHQTLRSMWPNISSEILFRRLSEISQDTDILIRRLLFDEQLRDYERIKSDAGRSQARRLAVYKNSTKSLLSYQNCNF
jgi:hypothetical protein